LQRNLGENLILRCLEETDVEKLVVHVNSVLGPTVGSTVQRILNYYPHISLTDHFLVVDKQRGEEIVAYLCLLRKTSVLNGVEIQDGQMDLVGTHPRYRHRGLIRRLNEAFEERAAEYGLRVLAIAGIPSYYRLFGYEYAVTMEKSITIPSEAIPELKKGETEPVSIERVTPDSFQDYLSCRAKRNSFLDLYRKIGVEDSAFLNSGKLGEAGAIELYLVQQEGKPVGSFYLEVAFERLVLRELWLEDARWLPSVLRFAKEVVKRTGLPLKVDMPSKPSLSPYLERISGSRPSRAYAWYVKIPSIKLFLETIAPVLAARLESSEFQGLTDTLRLSWYREGVELVFRDGLLEEVNTLDIRNLTGVHVSIPPGVIYQLLLGYRTFTELREIYPDVQGYEKTSRVEVLFPRVKASLTPDL